MDSLPVEVIVHILAYLPAKQVLATRRLSSRFCSVIDTPGNATCIAHPIQHRARRHLHHSLAQTARFPPSVSFLESLRQWLTTRGIPATPQDRLVDLWSFADIWYTQRRNPASDPVDPAWMLLYETRTAASVILGAYLRHHLPAIYTHAEFTAGRYSEFDEERVETATSFQSAFGGLACEMYGWSAEEILGWYRELHSRRDEGGYFREAEVWPRVLSGDGGEGGVPPMWMLSSISIAPRSNMAGPICDSALLERLLGVPAVPRRMGFCVYSDRAWNAVRDMTKDDRVLPPLVRAAVLEDVDVW